MSRNKHFRPQATPTDLENSKLAPPQTSAPLPAATPLPETVSPADDPPLCPAEVSRIMRDQGSGPGPWKKCPHCNGIAEVTRVCSGPCGGKGWVRDKGIGEYATK